MNGWQSTVSYCACACVYVCALVCVCVPVCVYVCVCVHACVRVRACMHACACVVHACVRVYAYMCVCEHARDVGMHCQFPPLPFPAVDFFNQINMLYGTITEFCTPESCPVMSAGPK